MKRKPGKDRKGPKSNRPIGLLSIYSKLVERLLIPQI